MSPEERQLLAGLFDRIKSNGAAPRDAEAEAFIADQLKALPAAPYLLAQTVIVQDFALQQANQKLEELEKRLHEFQSKPATSFLGGLFGGGLRSSAPPPPPPPRPAPGPAYGQPQGGPWGGGAPQQGYAAPQAAGQGGFAPQAGSQGGGFLKGALGTAAGVAGGVLLADSIRGLFHGGGIGSGLGIDSGLGHAGFGGGETIINNYYETPEGQQDASYDASYDDDGGPQDADYQDDSGNYDDGGGYDSGGDGGFDV